MSESSFIATVDGGVHGLRGPLEPALSVALVPLPTTAELARRWRELETRAESSIFNSWTWIGNWLAVLRDPAQAQLVQATCAGRIVGLGVAVAGRTKLLKLIGVRAWHLHGTGIDEFDDLSIEYNGFLVDRDGADDIRRVMLQQLLFESQRGVVEISGADAAHASLAARAPHGMLARAVQRPTFLVSLEQARSTPGGYLSLLSANTRAQVRRSLKAYAALGTVRLEEAASLEQARSYLERLRDLHTDAWERKGVRSAFAHDDVALRFHERLLSAAFDRGEVQMLRVTAGDVELGYLYNFVYRDTVCFYQSGLSYGLVNKHDRPGLVCHALAIDHNVSIGHDWYDFLAGDQRYKASMATHRDAIARCVFLRDTMLPRLDNWARRLWAVVPGSAGAEGRPQAPFGGDVKRQLPTRGS